MPPEIIAAVIAAGVGLITAVGGLAVAAINR